MILLVAGMLLTGGIGKVRRAAARTERMNAIRNIGIMYKFSTVQLVVWGPPPSPPKQASDLLERGPVFDDAKTALTDGSFVLIYRVYPDDMQNQGGASQLVLGYEPRVATDEGFVLMGDGEVKYVTAEEFKTLPKAEPLHWREQATGAINVAYRRYLATNAGKAPTRASDLTKELNFERDEDAKNWLTDGSFVFIYGVTPDDIDKQGDPSQLVLGYERRTATDKGFVLMGDGRPMCVTAAEFKAMQQANPGEK
jgi:hypothetical protein